MSGDSALGEQSMRRWRGMPRVFGKKQSSDKSRCGVGRVWKH